MLTHKLWNRVKESFVFITGGLVCAQVGLFHGGTVENVDVEMLRELLDFGQGTALASALLTASSSSPRGV